jgi:hypothetical protein
MAPKNRPSVRKREREQLKRQRGRQKAEKMAERRERRTLPGGLDASASSVIENQELEVNRGGDGGAR